MQKLHICLRPEDQTSTFDHIYRALLTLCRREEIIDLSTPIPEHYQEHDYVRWWIEQSYAQVILIGKAWGTATNKAGKLWFEDDADLVRQALIEAEKRLLPRLILFLDDATDDNTKQLQSILPSFSALPRYSVRLASLKDDLAAPFAQIREWQQARVHPLERPTIQPPQRKVLERFTIRARRSLGMSEAKAKEMGHRFINPEHVLWAIVQDADGLAAKVFAELGCSVHRVDAAFEELAQSQESKSRKRKPPVRPSAEATQPVEQDVVLAEDTKWLLELAVDEARQRGDTKIGTHDLLLGIRKLPRGAASTMLDRFGMGLGLLRKTVKVVEGRHPGLS
jgi:hypothetical protein